MMIQTVEEANQILDQLMDIASTPTNFVGTHEVKKESLRRLSPQSKLINLLQLAQKDKWIDIMSMVPAIVDQTLLEWIDKNAELARANDDDAAVKRFQRMSQLAKGMMEP
ncbi:MAG: hypothetical protein HPY30_00815 [Gammaproteobacteria bacterium (ex Lamellibrachia satsuma)]|nr:MAG: hypothetical protein HPY30_00815 [Gammaproteobacteria bacterium (ex Lamellibrachia satsuma)]